MVFRKNLRSLECRWEKISKFLGDLPSEQIFYRNIPLGAPEKKTKAVENYRPSRNCRIGFKSKSVMFSVLTCYVIYLTSISCILFDWNSV